MKVCLKYKYQKNYIFFFFSSVNLKTWITPPQGGGRSHGDIPSRGCRRSHHNTYSSFPEIRVYRRKIGKNQKHKLKTSKNYEYKIKNIKTNKKKLKNH